MKRSEFNYKTLNQLYDYENQDKVVYSSYLLKGKIHKIILYLNNIHSEDDKYRNHNRNVRISSFIEEAYTKNKNIIGKSRWFIAPQITFWKMFKNDGTDIRPFIRTKRTIYIEFKILTKRRYELIDFKEVEDEKK